MHPLARQTFFKAAALVLGCVIAISALPMAGLARDPDAVDPSALPPEGTPMKIEVPRGGAVLITLSAYAVTSPITRFRIKRKTYAGRLGTPRMATATTALVRYQPPAGAGPGDDSFSFEVQSDAGVSAPAEVEIAITDKAPLFIAPTDVEFGQVLTGGSVRKSLDLQNLGGGMAEGTVKVPDGWSVDGDPDYQLGPGAKQTFTLIFTPSQQQPYTGDIEYTGNLDRATDLNGEGVGPLAVTTGTVQLASAGGARTGAIHVVNHTSGALTVRLTPGPTVSSEATAMVPANGAADIAVSATGSGYINDHVTVAGEGLKTDVAIYAVAAAPPQPADLADDTTPPATGAATPDPPPATGMARVANNDTAAAPAPDDSGAASMSLPPLTSDNSQDTAPEGVEGAALLIGRVGQTQAEVGCDFKGDTQAYGYRLELQTIGIDAQDRPFPKWIPFPGATLTIRGQAAIAEMTDLQPGTLYVVRIVGLDNEGQYVEISTVQGVTTVAAPPPWWQRWAVEEVGIVAVGAGIWWWKKKRVRRRWW